MVSIVIVSHSQKIAQGIHELISQMVSREVPFAIAAGLNVSENEIGTDPIGVQQAIESVPSNDGIVVLMDIGSALLSAEIALEFLSPDVAQHVHLCEAPLIEGSIAAVVTASTGGTIDQVLHAARNALAAKQKHMSNHIPMKIAPHVSKTLGEISSPILEVKLTLSNHYGLHMRPAAKLIQSITPYDAAVHVYAHGNKANARNINQLMRLDAAQGDEIIFEISGADTEIVRQKIENLINNNFGDSDIPDTQKVVSHGSIDQMQPKEVESNFTGGLFGNGVIAGIACGVVRFHPHASFSITDVDAEGDWQALLKAIEATNQELLKIERENRSRLGQQELAIFSAHRLMLQDRELLDHAKQLIEERGLPTAAAWRQVIRHAIAQFNTLSDEHLRRRTQDLLDVGHRVLAHLNGAKANLTNGREPHVLAASQLMPSEVNLLNPAFVLGLILEHGSETDHSVILARALGIPTIISESSIFSQIEEGKMIAFDGETGQIWLSPQQQQVINLQMQQAQRRKLKYESVPNPPLTKDAQKISLLLNLNRLSDLDRVSTSSASGVGLCRSEYLFAHLPRIPTEQEQVASYRAIAQRLGKRPVTIRLFDFGGDKQAPFLPSLKENNPMLGLRGIRLLLEWPDLLQAQLLAILQASHETRIQILVPMVSAKEELNQIKNHIEQAKSILRKRKTPFNDSIQVGMMVETPAAVLSLPQLVTDIDFLSIGTNDLTQYMMAAERGNGRVAGLNESCQPAVLKSLDMIAHVARSAPCPVTVCGEMANHPLYVPLLIGLGFQAFSMHPLAIPSISRLIQQLDQSQMENMANTALKLPTASGVKAALSEFVQEVSGQTEADLLANTNQASQEA